MNIIVDVMGEDRSPIETVKGLCLAAKELKNVQFTVVGDKAVIEHHMRENGCDPDAIINGLKAFGGAKRRFEFVKVAENGARVYNDYAHHPSEIKATLSAAKAFGKRVVCVFQPHTYSRTASLFEDFTRAFSDSDITLFADIYAARETDTLGVSSSLLSEKTPNSIYLGDFESVAKYINANCTENDLVLILGAGDIVNISKLLV
jgi:UDP-N-acetylmuramate--alanine ligase